MISQLSKAGITLVEVDLIAPDESIGNDEQEVLLHELFDVDVLIGATYSPAWISTLDLGVLQPSFHR